MAISVAAAAPPPARPAELYNAVISAFMAAQNHEDTQEKTPELITEFFAAANVNADGLGPFEFRGHGQDSEVFREHRQREALARCYACACARSDTYPAADAEVAVELTRCVTAWRSPTVELIGVARLSGPFTFAANPLKLEEGVLIRDVHDPPAAFLRGLEATDLRPRLSSIPPPCLMLTVSHDIAKIRDDDMFIEQITHRLTRAITAMRIAEGVWMGAEHILIGPSDLHYQTDSIPTWIQDTLSGGIAARHCCNNSRFPADFTSTRSVQRQLLMPEVQSLRLAIERFNLAFTRQSPEDQLIDLAIALENTLLRGGSEGALSYRFALYGTAIIDADAPQKVFDLFGAFYGARNKIVHGGHRLRDLKAKDLAGLAPEQFIGVCHEYTRQVLRYFLDCAEHGRSPAGVIDAVKARLIDALGPTREGEPGRGQEAGE